MIVDIYSYTQLFSLLFTFTGYFTESSRSFTDCGFLPLPLSYLLPLFTPG